VTPAPSDQELLTSWGAGNRRAGADLVERHYPAIERFFAYKAPDVVDDLVQRTFLLCAESAKDFRGDGSVRAFLFGIARNVLYEHIRACLRDRPGAVDPASQSIADLMPGVVTLAAASSDRRQLVLALQRIALDLQILLELFYWEELSVEELAAMMGLPAGTIKSRLHRARTALREEMEKLPGKPAELENARTLLEKWLTRVRQ